jgi:hypothetical protein
VPLERYFTYSAVVVQRGIGDEGGMGVGLVGPLPPTRSIPTPPKPPFPP